MYIHTQVRNFSGPIPEQPFKDAVRHNRPLPILFCAGTSKRKAQVIVATPYGPAAIDVRSDACHESSLEEGDIVWFEVNVNSEGGGYNISGTNGQFIGAR